MKTALRTITFVIISLEVSQRIIPAFFFGLDSNKIFLLLVLALFILCMLLLPILKILGFGSKGLGFLLFLFVMTSVVVYVSTLIIPGFSLQSAKITDLIIFGFMLPSKSFDPIGAGIVSSLVFSITYTFLGWLCSKTKR